MRRKLNSCQLPVKRKKYHLLFVIECVPSTKLLGLLFVDNLKWNEQVASAIKSASKLFYYIVCLKRARIDSVTLFRIYCSLVRPLLSYSAPTTLNMSQQLHMMLLKTEKRFLRLIQHQPDKHLTIYILNIAQKFVHTVNKNENHPFRQCLISIQPRRTRSQKTLVPPKSRTTLKKNTILSFF